MSCDLMVFSKCSFKECHPCFQQQRRVFSDQVKLFFSWYIFDRIVQIGHNGIHHQLPGVPSLEKVFIFGTQHLSVPGHVTESFHLIVIKIRSKKTGYAAVFLLCYSVGNFMVVGQKIIDLAQLAPGPTARTASHGDSSIALDPVGNRKGYHIIRITIVCIPGFIG